LAGSVSRMLRPWRVLHAELYGDPNQQARPPMRRAHAPSWRKTLVMPIASAAAIGRLPCRCPT
jgi:hypothetical protein